MALSRPAAVDQHLRRRRFRQRQRLVDERLVQHHLAHAAAAVGGDHELRTRVVDGGAARLAAASANHTEWIAPMRAQARIAKTASGSSACRR